MSQIVEGQVDGIVNTRAGLFAGNTNATMQPMDVAEAAYYLQHPDEKPGAQPDALNTGEGNAAAPAAETPAPEPVVITDAVAVFTDFEITPENAETVKNFVTRGEFNRFVDATNEAFQILEDRIAKYNKGASHKF
jgi:hypothetical protein